MKIKVVLVALLFVSSFLNANVMSEMFQMGREMGVLLQADSAQSFQQSAEKFLVVAKQAQQTMPASLDDDQEKFKGYQKGMGEIIDVVEQAKELALAGKLDEAKEKIEKLSNLKKKYHSEYK